MNSHQRRVINRYWKFYTVISEDSSYEDCIVVSEWCRKHFGKIGYRWGNNRGWTGFWFRKEQDFILFTLKWS